MGRRADTSDIRAGDCWHDSFGVVRVMAVAEGYVMYKRRGCFPGVMHHNLFRKVHKFADAALNPKGNADEV